MLIHWLWWMICDSSIGQIYQKKIIDVWIVIIVVIIIAFWVTIVVEWWWVVEIVRLSERMMLDLMMSIVCGKMDWPTWWYMKLETALVGKQLLAVGALPCHFIWHILVRRIFFQWWREQMVRVAGWEAWDIVLVITMEVDTPTA